MTTKTETTKANRRLRGMATGLLLALSAASALAHHGWSWAEEKQTVLEGKIVSVSMAPPHPQLQVQANDGSRWQIDLANPAQTDRSGFTANSANAGDRVTVLGNRNKEPGKRHMKAVRITIDGRNYDLYPERLADMP
jgi:hypothetical protein